MPRDDAEGLLSVAQAATLVGVHPNTIRAWTDAGRLAAYRINARGDRRFRRDDVARLLVEDAGGVDVPPRAIVGRSIRDTEVSVFGRISTELPPSPTTAMVARAVVEAMRAEAGAERAAVYTADGDRLLLEAHAGFEKPPVAVREMPAEEVGARNGETALLLATRQGPAGLLVLDSASWQRMAPGFLRALLATVATTLASARLLGRARRELQRARALRAVTKELTGSLELGAVLGDVVERTRTLFEADRAGLWLVDGGEHPFTVAAHHGLSDRFLAEVAALRGDEDTIGTRALRDRRPHAVRNAESGGGLGQLGPTYADEGIRSVCLVPLIGGDEPLGLLGLYHGRDRAWPDDEVALVQAFADQAAVAISNARLYRSVADHAARMRSIQDLSSRLNRLTDVRAIAEAIVAEARTLAEYHDIRVYRVDHEQGMCEPIAFTRRMLEGDPRDPESLLRLAIGEGFAGWVAEHGEPLLINDTLQDDRGKTIDGTDDVAESMLVVPMLYEGRALGVIALSQLGLNRFSAEDLQTMSIFAGYAAQAMANAAHYEQMVAKSTELARRAESQHRLLEINERLLGTLDEAGVLETIADRLRDVVAYDNLSIYRADPVQQMMQPVLTRERHAEEVSRYPIPFGRGLMGWAVGHSQPVLANDALGDPRALQIPGTPADPEAVVVVPLVADGEVLGALNVSRVGGREVHFSESDFELVQLFAAQASIALRNADAHRAMTQRADTDALTGLGNHGAFQRDLLRLLEDAGSAPTEAGRHLSVLMMDLDRFKTYNDRHGHPAGDALLHRAGAAIQSQVRGQDRVYRYGGDEFAIILPGTTVADAVHVAERMRQAVARLTLQSPSPVTVTAGVAGVPGDAEDRGGLVAAADAALYHGKRTGEDRVVRADHLVPELGDPQPVHEVGARFTAPGQNGRPASAEPPASGRPRVPGAGEEAEGLVLDGLLGVARSLERGSLPNRGHADRMGRLAAAMAARLGLHTDERRRIELAARLHSVDDLALEELGRIPALRGVAAIIAGHRAPLADGAPAEADSGDGSVGGHVLGVAKTYDELVSGVGQTRVGRVEALAQLRADPASWRLDVLAALAETLQQQGAGAGRGAASGATLGEAPGAA